MSEYPKRGEVWIANFDPVVGHEQGGTRMCIVASVDRFNESKGGLVMACPTTTRDRGLPVHIRIDPPEGGLRETSFVKCDNLRSISVGRLHKKLGKISSKTQQSMDKIIKILLGL